MIAASATAPATGPLLLALLAPQPLGGPLALPHLPPASLVLTLGPAPERPVVLPPGLRHVHLEVPPLPPGRLDKLILRLALDQHCHGVLLVSGELPASALADTLRDLAASPCELLLAAPPQSTKPGPLWRWLGRWTVHDWLAPLRYYSAAFLRAVPFELNSDDLRARAQLLCQAEYLGATVRHLALPGLAPVVRPPMARWRLARVLLELRRHRFGIFCSLRYRNLAPIRYQDKTGMLYNSHHHALSMVARLGCKRVLDLGCGPGFVARACRRLGATVTGVDRYQPLAETVDHFYPADLDATPLPVAPGDYELILLMDVIEHLREPEQFLLNLRHQLGAASAHPPRLLLSTPNIAFIAVRLNLLLGRFPYAERGILDITHTRLFTRRTLLRTLRDCGYQVHSLRGIGVPFEAVLPGRLGRLLGYGADLLARLWPSLFAFQFMILCQPEPTVHQWLRQFLPGDATREQ